MLTLQSAFGALIILALAWAAGENRRYVSLRAAFGGLVITFLFAALLIKLPFLSQTIALTNAGVEAIAHTMNASLDTLVDEVEPFLLRSELVVRTPRGRKLTAKAYKHLGVTPPPDEPQLPLFK
mgnify:CR=1 FL=1